MTQIEQDENEMVSGKKEGIQTVKTHQERSKLVHPGKRTFRNETAFVNVEVEEAFASTFGTLAVTRIFSNIGNKLMVETSRPCRAGVKGTIGIETAPAIDTSRRLMVLKAVCKCGLRWNASWWLPAIMPVVANT